MLQKAIRHWGSSSAATGHQGGDGFMVLLFFFFLQWPPLEKRRKGVSLRNVVVYRSNKSCFMALAALNKRKTETRFSSILKVFAEACGCGGVSNASPTISSRSKKGAAADVISELMCYYLYIYDDK